MRTIAMLCSPCSLTTTLALSLGLACSTTVGATEPDGSPGPAVYWPGWGQAPGMDAQALSAAGITMVPRVTEDATDIHNYIDADTTADLAAYGIEICNVAHTPSKLIADAAGNLNATALPASAADEFPAFTTSETELTAAWFADYYAAQVEGASCLLVDEFLRDALDEVAVEGLVDFAEANPDVTVGLTDHHYANDDCPTLVHLEGSPVISIPQLYASNFRRFAVPYGVSLNRSAAITTSPLVWIGQEPVSYGDLDADVEAFTAVQGGANNAASIDRQMALAHHLFPHAETVSIFGARNDDRLWGSVQDAVDDYFPADSADSLSVSVEDLDPRGADIDADTETDFEAVRAEIELTATENLLSFSTETAASSVSLAFDELIGPSDTARLWSFRFQFELLDSGDSDMNRARLGRIQLSGDGGATLAVDLERLRSGNDVNDNYLQDVYYVGDGLFPAGWVRPDIGWVPPILDDSELVDHAAGAARLHLFTHGDGYTNWASELVPDILEAGETYALTVLHYEDADGYYVSLALTEADDDTLVYMSQPIESEKLEVTDLTLAIPASHTKGIVATSADVNLGGELLVEDFRFWTRPPVKTWTGAELVAAGSGWDNISYAHIDDGQRELTPDGDSLHAEFSGDDFTCQPVNPANGRCLYERTLALDLPDSCAEEIEIEVSYQPQADANGSSDNDLAMAFGDGTSLIASGIYDDRTRIELIDYTDGDDIVSDTVALVAASNLSHGQVKAVAGAALTGVLTLTADGTDNYDVRMDGDRDGTYTVTLTEEDVGSSSFASGTYSPTTAYILMGDRHEAYVIDEVRITGCDFDPR